VVDAPTVFVEANVGGLDEVDDALGDFGFSGRGVFDVEELLREPVEVVDRTRDLHRCDGGDVHVPVRRGDEDRLGRG